MAVTPQKQLDQKDDALFDDDAELQRVLDQWQRALSEIPEEGDIGAVDIVDTGPVTAPDATTSEIWPPAEEPPGTSWRRIAAAAAVAKAAKPAPSPQRAAPTASEQVSEQVNEPVMVEPEKAAPAKAEPEKARPDTAEAIKPLNNDAGKQQPAAPDPVAPKPLAPAPSMVDEQSPPARASTRPARKRAAISGDKSRTRHHKPATPVTLPRARLEKAAKRPAEAHAANQNTTQERLREAPPPFLPVEARPIERSVESKPVEDEPVAPTTEAASPPRNRGATPIPANENSIAQASQPTEAAQPSPQKTAKPAPGAHIAPSRKPERKTQRKPQWTSADNAGKTKEKPADKWRRQHPRATQTGSPFEIPLPPKPSGRRKPPIVSAKAVKMYTDIDESAKKPPIPKTRRENGPQEGLKMERDRDLGAKPGRPQPQRAARRAPNPRAQKTAKDLTPGTMRMTAPADERTKPKTTPDAAKSVAETPSGKGANDENFPVGSFLLPAKLRPHVAKYYAFARAVDDIADNPELTPEDKIARLDAFDAALHGKSGYGDDYAKAHDLRQSLQQLDITTDHGSHLLIAFREDAVKTRYANWAELMHYCSNSANPVGRYLLDLHGEAKADYPYSDALCTVLQVLNHMQDCADDLANLDRCYIPQDWMAAEGTSTEDLTKPALTPGMRAVFDRMLDEIDDMMRTARVLPVVMKNRHLAMESATIVNLADRLAAKLRQRDPLAARVSLSKADFAFSGLAGILKGLFKK